GGRGLAGVEPQGHVDDELLPVGTFTVVHAVIAVYPQPGQGDLVGVIRHDATVRQPRAGCTATWRPGSPATPRGRRRCRARREPAHATPRPRTPAPRSPRSRRRVRRWRAAARRRRPAGSPGATSARLRTTPGTPTRPTRPGASTATSCARAAWRTRSP